jgi:hypothetical protein
VKHVSRRLFMAILALAGPAAASEEKTLKLPSAPIPENAAFLAEWAVRTVRKVDGAELDYSPASLKHIDRIVLGFRERGKTFNDMGETVFLFGCYVGEVIVRNKHAKWVMPEDKLVRMGFRFMGVQTSSGAFWDPIGKTIKLLANGNVDSVEYFYTTIT